jgi:hypothetical protein
VIPLLTILSVGSLLTLLALLPLLTPLLPLLSLVPLTVSLLPRLSLSLLLPHPALLERYPLRSPVPSIIRALPVPHPLRLMRRWGTAIRLPIAVVHEVGVPFVRALLVRSTLVTVVVVGIGIRVEGSEGLLRLLHIRLLLLERR